jgi:predicted anti-sigma-YlaC factor YlaD
VGRCREALAAQLDVPVAQISITHIQGGVVTIGESLRAELTDVTVQITPTDTQTVDDVASMVRLMRIEKIGFG